MSMLKKYANYGIGLLAVAVVAFAATNLPAASLYWLPPYVDESGEGMADNSGGGSGEWNTVDMSWGTDPNNPPDTIWSVGSTDDAVFDAGLLWGGASPGGDVYIQTPGGISVKDITFEVGGYKLQAWDASSILTLQGTMADPTPTIKVTPGGESAKVYVQLAGTSGMEKTGAGILQILANATYTGGTTVREGTLFQDFNNRLRTDQPITVTGTGIYDLGSNIQATSGAFVIDGGTVTAGTINKSGANYDARSGVASAKLSGGVGLDKTTAGTFTLSGPNDYTGLTTINGGVVNLGGTTQSLPGGLSLISGTLQNGTFNNTGAANFDLREGTVSANLGGAVGITKTTTGTLVLLPAKAWYRLERCAGAPKPHGELPRQLMWQIKSPCLAALHWN
jgi:autotransporter-associated beta strand protein